MLTVPEAHRLVPDSLLIQLKKTGPLRLLMTRKGTLALIAIAVSSVGLFKGVLVSADYVHLVEILVGSYSVTQAVEDVLIKKK